MSYSEKRNESVNHGIIFTDFDGTLFNNERYIAEENFQALEKARSRGFITAIATGRSLFSFRRVAETINKPIYRYFDYLIFSSGAGIVRSFEGIRGFQVPVTSNDIIEAEQLTPAEAFGAAGLLFRQGIDFMIQKAVPDNHYFTYVKSNQAVNPDFYRRIKIYSGFAEPLDSRGEDTESENIEKTCYRGVSQLVAIIPPSENCDGQQYSSDLVEYLRHRLDGCSVVRTTSPIDKRSLWIEIFHPKVSKSKAAARITEKQGLTSRNCLAIGNDFNDEDMLAWAGAGRTVDEAPEALKNQFRTAGRAIDGAVGAAILEFIG